MNFTKGVSRPETRRDRARLSVRDPMVENLVGNLDSDGDNLEELRAVCKAICRQRNAWSIRSRSGLLGSSGRIGKADADRALKQELAKIAKAGAE